MSLWEIIISKIKFPFIVRGSAALALALAIKYLLKSKSLQAIAEVKLSYFLLALKQNLISEI